MANKPNIDGFTHALTAANRQLAQRMNFADFAHSSDTKHPDSWQDYGYPETLEFFNYYFMYRRNAWAQAIVDRPVETCWQKHPWIMTDEGRKGEDYNAWESKLAKFIDKFQLFHKMKELDRMQAIGQYAAIIVEVKDGRQLIDPIGRVNINNVIGFKVVTEGMLEPVTFEESQKSDRYGLPVTYQLNESGLGDDNPDVNNSTTIHWSRLCTWSEGAINDGIYGNSSLEPVFNTLLNIEKVGGAGGEGSWKSSRGSMTMNISTDADINKLAAMYGVDLAELPDAISEQVADFNRNLDSVLAAQGVDFKPLQITVPDPSGFMEIYKDELAAGSGIPLTEMIGQQVDERSSTENAKIWAGKCESRQKGFLSPSIRKLINWLMDIGLVEKADFVVLWDQLYQPSLADKLDIISKMVDSNLKHSQSLSTLIGVGIMSDQPSIVFSINEMRELADYDAMEKAEIDDDYGEGEEKSNG